MLRAESRWVGQQLRQADPAPRSRLLNIGSSTGVFESLEQPWLRTEVLAVAEELGVELVNVDRKAEPGVDRVGDLLDPAFRAQLAEESYSLILLCNVLEHVAQRQSLCAAVEEMVPSGGRLIVTCPRVFPHHADPIDTMFRPTPGELAAEFPDLLVVAAAELRCRRYGWYRRRYVRHDGGSLPGDAAATLRGALRHPGSTSAELRQRWARTVATGVVLTRP